MRISNLMKSTRLVAVLASFLFVFAVACGDDGNGGGGGNNNNGADVGPQPDTGPNPDTNTDPDTSTDPDSGDPDGGDPDSGDPDSGDPDGGTPGECEPLDPSPADQAECSLLCQTGCDDGQACVYGEDGAGSTVMACQPEGPSTQGDVCDQTTACAAGYICLLENAGDTEGVCHEVCRPNSTDEPQCTTADANCQPLDINGVGACTVPEDTCTQWPNDDCPDGQNCYALQGGGTSCFDYNDTAEAGNSCSSPTDCNDAQICAGPDADSAECFDRCQPNEADPGCGADEQCSPLQDDPDQGVCVAGQ